MTRFTIRWDISMGCYRVSIPNFQGPLEVVPADQYDRERAAANEAVADLCALAEDQQGNPHDDLSNRLYEIAHKIELGQVEPVHA